MNRYGKSLLPMALTLLGMTSAQSADTGAAAVVQSVQNRFAKIPGSVAPIANEPIVVTKSLAVQLTYDSSATTQHCTNKDLNQALATVLLFDHAGMQKEIGRFTVKDLWGGISCNGHANQSKTFPVELKEKGQYILVITALSSLYHWHGGEDLIITPRLVVTADNATAVDHTFASPGGEQTTNEAHSVT